MTPCGLCVAFLFLIVQTCTVRGDDIIKSSLTFVIDDTASMWNEIDQVKRDANSIFETVLTTNASQIENFILVTFNDPDARLRTVTKDRDEFKRALADIDVHGGDDCPEYAMTGIEIALAESLPLSYLYVFTDASAKDYAKFDQIKSLSQKQQSQVTFVLTDICGTKSDVDYQVYHKVAEATNGQVFHVIKDGITPILKYVKETIKGRGEVLVSKKIPPGPHKIDYPVDVDTGDVLISLTGKSPKIGEVTGPDGSKPAIETIVDEKEVVAKKITGAKPGTHEVEVGGDSETHAVITAKISITFQLGFSTFKPTSIRDTATRPGPYGNAFLSIKLNGEGVKLRTAKVIDMSDNVISELLLTLVDEKEKFYVAPLFDPPNTMFRVTVAGYDVESKTPITRTSPTPIERQNPAAEKKENVAPSVTIDGAPIIIVDYDSPLQLKCKVHGYPQPDIVWKETDTGNILPAKVSVIEVPYDYISILDMEKANKNSSYQCEASNPYGVNIKYIEVETKRNMYFNVIEAPGDDIKIQYNKEGSIVCKVDAYPPADINWYKNGIRVTRDGNIEVSKDKSILTIKHMQPESQGKFICEARNDVNRKVFYTNVHIVGLEKPKIDKSLEEIRVREGTNAELSCRVIQGNPKPSLRWSFRPEYKEKFIEMNETSDIIHLKNVSLDEAGSYKCIAKNFVGSDRFNMDLEVEYPPRLREEVKLIRGKDGEEIIIPCKIDGVPTPTVTWFYNGTRVKNTPKTRIHSDHSLKLRATIADTGYYKCKAENEVGSINTTIFVEIFVPVVIDVPKATTIESMVGKNVVLPCRADGYPRPGIKWTFRSFDPKIPPKDISPIDGTTSVVLRKVQLNQQGFYSCIVDSGVESANLTYELKVYAPPIIENMYPDKTFKVVEGDLALRIMCKATGSPKPTIVWKKNDLNLAIGSDWYDMEEDGTLVIKNVDDLTNGSYICQAQNVLGIDTEAYDVEVSKFPKPEKPTSTIFVEEGKTVDLKCDIPHKNTDLLRWYQHDKEIAMGELTLFEVTRRNDGLYTCRVSDFSRSRSATTEVRVGFKPKFITDEEENIDFVHEALVLLVCEAEGEPMPKVIWKHHGKEISISEMTYPLQMKLSERGIYTCEVINDFGSIHRSFNIKSRDCILNIKKDFPDRQPLMLSPSLTWPTFEITEGYMVIPHESYYFLNCPHGFTNYSSTTNFMAYCEGETKMKINGVIYDFSEIQCQDEVKPDSVNTGIHCHIGNTEYIKVGYRIYNQLVKVYEVCFDKDKNITLFAKHKLSPDHTDANTEPKWISSHLLPQDFDTIYDCKTQVDDMTSILGRDFLKHDSCCFARRQLVSSHDLRPGIPTTVSHSYLNVIPHWSTCNAKNWDDLEKRVRNLVKSAGRDLLISTGTTQPLRLVRRPSEISLHDGRGGSQPVAQYLWKVVQDPPSSTSLAIIQVNVPGLLPTEAPKHVLCGDICDRIDWMKGSDWHNVENGFTYCCTIREFEKAFGYDGKFSPGMNFILSRTSLIPEYYLSKK